jgi:hypothetical protein
MSVTVTRKPVDLTAWHLVDQAAMLDALGVLSADGWRGSLSPVDDAWRLEMNADDPVRQIIAQLGDWLVMDGGWLRKLSAVEITANYEVPS